MKARVLALVLTVAACASERIDTSTSLEPLIITRVEDGHRNGPVAVCGDGRFSYNEVRRDTCAGHGGPRTWMVSTYRVFALRDDGLQQRLTRIPLNAEEALAEALKLEADGYETVGLMDLETGKSISLEEFRDGQTTAE